ncbi:hypothetical protein NEUTE2DRAFT_133218 [Neurospora tetrasperma FGSC 2509]|nr:hypothetical protein NEUTE2DRAFT_133218 [Neurospora tetrasperma FGSC 2509]
MDGNEEIDIFEDGQDGDDDDGQDVVGQDVFAAIRRHNVTTQRSRRGIHRMKYPVDGKKNIRRDPTVATHNKALWAAEREKK